MTQVEVLDYVVPPLIPNIEPQTHTIFATYVCKNYYDQQIMIGQDTTKKAIKQLKCDINRIKLRIDGKRCVEHSKVPRRFIRYCTQSVMVLPLEMICFNSKGGVVAECEHPVSMIVDLISCKNGNDYHLIISKSLRFLDFDKKKQLPLTIHIDLSDKESLICISIYCGRWKTFNI